MSPQWRYILHFTVRNNIPAVTVESEKGERERERVKLSP
jgi:hypothetical protein